MDSFISVPTASALVKPSGSQSKSKIKARHNRRMGTWEEVGIDGSEGRVNVQRGLVK